MSVYVCSLSLKSWPQAAEKPEASRWARPPAGPSDSKRQIERKSLTPHRGCQDPK